MCPQPCVCFEALCFRNCHTNKSPLSFVVLQSLTHQVGLAGCVVFLGAHSNQAVVVEKNAKRVAGSDKDVDAQVKLVALHQEGLVQVLLNDKVLLGWQLLTVTDKRDPG